jgi:hypothetical protein
MAYQREGSYITRWNGCRYLHQIYEDVPEYISVYCGTGERGASAYLLDFERRQRSRPEVVPEVDTCERVWRAPLGTRCAWVLVQFRYLWFLVVEL